MLSFSRALAAEQKSRGVRVVAVCPNPMHTAFFERAGEKPNLFKLLFFEKPRDVARAAMRDAAKGRDVSTNCRMAGLIRIAAKMLPHRAIIRIERLLMR